MIEDVITIASAQLTAGISALGAELQFLKDGADRNLQWDGDPAFWRGRAPILFPMIGLLEGGRYRLDGVSYDMPKHGFARTSRFDVVNRERQSVTFRLSASAATRILYPFEFSLDISFSILEANLTLTATITNAGKTDMPASFGFHPALRWPLPYGQPRDAHAIRFEYDEPAPVRRIDKNGFVLPEPQRTPVEGDMLVLRDDLFVEDALIFDRLKSRRATYGAQAGPRLVVEFADFPTLGVWTKPGAGFICIEPWQGVSDPVGFSGDIRDKPGIVEIPSGGSRRFAMQISLVG